MLDIRDDVCRWVRIVHGRSLAWVTHSAELNRENDFSAKNFKRMNRASELPISKSDRPKPELKILHISDLHFGPPFVKEVAEEAVRISHVIEPDVIVVSGDLTQRARRDQFLAANDYLGRFPKVPMLVIPGNHDVPLYRVLERFNDPHELYKEIISEELNPVLRLDSAVIVGLDSTAPRSAISNGRIHAWQLDFCKQVFCRSPSRGDANCRGASSFRTGAGLLAGPDDAQIKTCDHVLRRT